MKYFIHIACLLAFVAFSGRIHAQDSTITVRGQVYGINGSTDLLTLFVVSQNRGTGNFGNPNGTFEITVRQQDTIMIGSIGYFTERLCFADSAYKDTFDIKVQLIQLEYYLRDVIVLAPRDLESIYDDINELGYDPDDDRLTGIVDPLTSPITALYEMYSKRAQKERLAKQLINDAKRRDLLKELLAKYVDYGIIDLSDSQFDDFIVYLNVSDAFLKNSSQYDFIIYVKQKYKYYIKEHKYDEGWDQY